MASTPKLSVQSTKKYDLFQLSEENRPKDLPRHRNLKESMKRYGFLKCFPIICRRLSNGKLEIVDGQHRYLFATELDLPVHWIVTDEEFDVAVVNSTAKPWVLKDFAKKYSEQGLEDYQEAIDFAEAHRLPLGTAFALLSGVTSLTNCYEKVVTGKFSIVDRGWAHAVAATYGPLVTMSPPMKNVRLLEACMMVNRVPDFDSRRLISNAGRCRDKLVPYSTRDAYLDMLEEVYNYSRLKVVGLKAASINATRERNTSTKSNGKPSE